MFRKLRNNFFSNVDMKHFAKAGPNAKLLPSSSASLLFIVENKKMTLSRLGYGNYENIFKDFIEIFITET